MHNLVEYLKQLELSDIEAKLYTALLKAGPISVRELAKATDIKRTTAYFYIDQLVEKELLTKIVKGSHKLVAAIDPQETLKFLVKKKVASAEQAQKKLPSMLKAINLFSHNTKDADAEVKYYTGKNSVKKIYEEVLKAKEIRSFVDISQIAELFPENFQLFNDVFKNNSDVVMYEIVENSAQAKDYINFSSKNKQYSQKLLPDDIQLTAQDLLIYDNKVAIIHLQNKVTGLILSNKEVYNNFKLLFDFIWKTLPE